MMMSTKELQKEITELKIALAQGKLKDTNRIARKRRELARVLTRRRQKEILKND